MARSNSESLDSDIRSEGTSTHAEFPNWKNAPTIKDLQKDLQDSNEDHWNKTTKIDEWLDYQNITGKVKRKKVAGKSSVVPKVILKQAEWRKPSLSEPFLSTEDIFNVSPVTYADVKAAKQNEMVLNHQLNNRIDKVAFIDEYVATCVEEGTVIVRVGWESEEGVIEVEDFRYELTDAPEDAEQQQYLTQMKQSKPAEFGQLPEEIKEAHRLSVEQGRPVKPISEGMIEKTVLTVNQPTLEVTEYKNLIIDPSCKGNLEKAKFVIHSFATSLADLKEDGKYVNLDKVDMQGSNILTDPEQNYTSNDTSFNFDDKERMLAVAYEYWGDWDINGTGILEPIVATWIGNTLIRLDNNPFPDKGLPFVAVAYTPVRKSVNGTPDAELLKDNQDIIGATTRGMIDLMARSANGQQGSRLDALDVTNRRKFLKGEDYQFSPNVDPRLAFYTHTYPEIPQAAHQMIALQNADAESLTGVKAFSGGSGITGAALGDNVGGIKSALDATAKREIAILRRLASGLEKIARKIISMNSEFLDEVEVIRITDEEFVQVRRDDLAGKFDIKLTISTAEADEKKASELSFMLQTMGNTADPMLSKMILIKIADLRKMPDLSKQIEAFEPQPDPLAVKKAELEIALLEAEVATEQAKAQEIQAQAQLHMAKSRTEGSNADKTDLDFVEQETGTTQARDKEIATSQAQGNMALEAVKHEFKLRENAAKPSSKTKA